MIELRWIWKDQDTGLITSDMKPFYPSEAHPVLQYRSGEGHPIYGWTWGPWQDVPFPPMPEIYK